ncbi:MAG: menaquinol-cytochrome C reductase [Bacillota bacterium]|nr:menaquinol-cytochrome C reductase [Bacillota bacterium]
MSSLPSERIEEEGAPKPNPRERFFEDVPEDELRRVFVWPNLLSIELIGGLLLLLLLGLLAVLVNAPLETLANDEKTPDPSKAPWYFLGLQELLLHMHPSLAGVIVPGVVILGLMAIPYIDRERVGTGIYFTTKKGLPIALFSLAYTAVWEVALILMDQYLPAAEGGHGLGPYLHTVLGWPEWISAIVVPSAIMLFIPALLVLLVRRRWQADRREVMIALYAFFFASFWTLTLVGTFFRGESMNLVLPWNLPGFTQ